MKIKSNERNCSIDIFRIVCAIMVVAIHTQLLTDVDETIGYIATQVIPRIAVPFFFCTSGYFYISKLIQGKKTFINTMSKLLIVYTLWCIIYYAKDFINVLFKHESIKGYLISCVKNYFIYGPSYQLCFFPAIFLCIILTTFFYKIKLLNILAHASIVLYFIGCLGC